MAITFESRGTFNKTESLLRRMSSDDIFDSLGKYGQVGVDALESVTPVDTGQSARSWSYEIGRDRGYWTLSWHNQNRTRYGTPIVLLLQYGHGTGTGGYVAGQDFINPSIKPVFEQIIDDIRREVSPK